MSSKEKIIEMLGQDIPAVAVAAACGVTEGYISQLLADEEIHARVVELRTARAMKYVEHDNKLDELEKKALEKVENSMQFIMRPMEALKVWQVLNAGKRHAGTASQAPQGTGTLVTIDLPESAQVHIKMTADRQVIEVAGRSMVPMPSQQVAKLLTEKKTQRLLESSITDVQVKVEVPSLLDQI